MEMMRNLDGGVEVLVRGFGNVNVGACGCRFDLYLYALELFLRMSTPGHHDIVRIAGSD
jgi:hypothetical protein